MPVTGASFPRGGETPPFPCPPCRIQLTTRPRMGLLCVSLHTHLSVNGAPTLLGARLCAHQPPWGQCSGPNSSHHLGESCGRRATARACDRMEHTYHTALLESCMGSMCDCVCPFVCVYVSACVVCLPEAGAVSVTGSVLSECPQRL